MESFNLIKKSDRRDIDNINDSHVINKSDKSKCECASGHIPIK